MKSIITCLLLITNIAIAAPTDNNDITNIPAKSKLIFGAEVSFLPNTGYLSLDANLPGDLSNFNYCVFRFAPSQDARYIQAGRALSVASNVTTRELFRDSGATAYGEITIITLDNKMTLDCMRSARNTYPTRFKIGEIRSMLSRLGIQLSIAPSVPM